MVERFPHAVASFEPTTDGVLLWTRVIGGATDVSWCMGADPDLTEIVARGQASTDPEGDHTVVVDVQGLEPSTTYWYRFEVAGSRSRVAVSYTHLTLPTN